MGGSSSRESFDQILARLISEDVDPQDHDFWDDMWKTTLTVEDIFQLITPDAVRKIIRQRPLNLQTLFTQAVAQLYQVVETPYPVYFDQALNCARILARLLPFMLESKSKAIMELFWNKQIIPKSAIHEDDGTEPGNESKNDSGQEETTEELQETEPLAVILINSVFHLLFLPDFTIEDPNIDFNEEDVRTQAFKSALMWAPGVGSREKAVANSTQYDRNRIDILRLMIASFSDSLYQSPDSYDSCASLWLEVGTSAEAPYAEIVFYSLMNVVLGYDPVGWGLPYGNLVSTDTAKPLMETAVQALIILLDYGHPIGTPSPASPRDADHAMSQPVMYVDSEDVDAQGFNIFRRLLSSIEATDQLNFIFRGFSRLLNNVHQAQCTYLPYSVTKIDIEQELMVLLWKCLEEIPRFMPYVLRSCDVTELLVPICFFMLEGRRDPPRLGMLYLCTFTILKLSGERNFGVALNKPYQLRLPVDMPLFSGNHADLLVIVLHKLIVNGMDKLSALYNCFLTIICNISPYCKSLGAVASVKLVNLLQLFTSPRFLYASEGNHAYVALLLETFNNIVQYQYEGNVNLVYSIVRRREVFERLAALTLPAAIKNATDHAKKKTGSSLVSEASATANTAAKEGTSAESLHGDPTAAPTDLVSTRKIERLADGDRDADGKTEGSSGPPEEESADNRIQNTPSRFIPTEAWLQSVRAELPLNTITRLLKHLVPQVEELIGQGNVVDEAQVIDFIQRTTMVGLLPVPHPIVIRKYQPNKYTSLWFTAFMWGVIFMHNQTIPLFDGKTVRLFMVQSSD